MGLSISTDGVQYDFLGDRKAFSIHKKSAFLIKLNYRNLWLTFLSSELPTFALSQVELIIVLTESLKIHEGSHSSADHETLVLDFIRLISELDDPPAVTIDFMSICFSILLLNKISLEEKIDVLFEWMCLNDDDHITFDEFYLSLVSIERGIAYVLGIHGSKNEVVKKMAEELFSLFKLGSADKSVTKDQFFELCTNRQYPVRRLLETIGAPVVQATSEEEDIECITVSTADQHLGDWGDGGDQWLANPPWKKTAELMTPTNCSRDASKPAAALTLEWVHGYRGYDCRNNISYVGNSAFVFYTAALAIIQSAPARATGTTHSQSTMKQCYFGEHTDDVISLAVYLSPSTDNGNNEDNALVATGEVGKNPTIHIWRVSQLHSLASLHGFHKKGVCQLAFSRTGHLLFSVGIEYTVAIYDVNLTSTSLGKLIASANGPKGKIFHSIASAENDSVFITCGEKHVLFWSSTNGILSSESVRVPNKRTDYLSLTTFGNVVVAGNAEGELVLIKAGEAPKAGVVAHNKAVDALCSVALPHGAVLVLSGGKDGKVIIWNEDLTSRLCECVLPTSGGQVVSVRSVAVSLDHTRLLIGTQTCSIHQYDVTINAQCCSIATTALSPITLVTGHFKGEVWGLAVRPSPSNSPRRRSAQEGQYCTVGDDNFLRIWSLNPHRQLTSLNMGAMARACAYHPNGDVIAVGFGGTVGRGKSKQDGMFRVYRVRQDLLMSSSTSSESAIVQIYECQEAKYWISDIKFSADGSLLAVASHDDCIYTYSYANQYRRRAKFSKHSSFITHFDFSSDGHYIQSNCGAYELLYSDTKSGHPVVNSGHLKSVKWATSTCPLSWVTQGVWPVSGDGTDVNAVDLSPSQKYIATADDFGKVKLFRYPCVVKGAKYVEHTGHSSHVMNLRWLPKSVNDDMQSDYLISVGGLDKAVLVWRLDEHEHDNESEVKRSSDTPRLSPTDVSSEVALQKSNEALEDAIDDAHGGGDEFMAIKPWVGAIRAPSAWSLPASPEATSRCVTALEQFKAAHRDLDKPSEERLKEVSKLAQASLQAQSECGLRDGSAPDADELELEWVHGYRGWNSRNNLFHVVCNGCRCLVYPAASLGIVLDISARAQKYFKGHTNEIVSMAVLSVETGSIVATGQRGKAPVFVWDASSLEVKATVDTAAKAVLHLAFSGADGRLLIALGEENQVIVSDWRNHRIVANVQGEKGDVYHLTASFVDSNSFMTCGDKAIRMWTLNGRQLTNKKVSLSGSIPGTKAKPSMQNFLTCVECSGVYIVGCEDGSVYCVQNGVVTAIHDVHDSTETTKTDKKALAARGISAMTRSADSSILITAARNGTVVIWKAYLAEGKSKLERLKCFTIGEAKKIGSKDIVRTLPWTFLLSSQIQSIHICHSTVLRSGVPADLESGWFFAIGTRACEIFEMFLSDSGATLTQESPLRLVDENPLMRGHFSDELWGLACHPFKSEFCTVGDDRTLRLWDTYSYAAKGAPIQLGAMARACAYHPSGDVIAVGFGGTLGRGKSKQDGMIRLYAGNPLVKVEERLDAKKPISEVRFSPDGAVLAVGGHNDCILIYRVQLNITGTVLSYVNKFSKHNSYITHLDFSADGVYLQSNCGAYELLFSEVSSGRHITTASELKDLKWATWTCTLGWPVQGIWPPGTDGTDINSVDRSHSGHLIATADDFSKVKIFRYPCLDTSAQALVFSGHSSHVTNVRWVAGDTHLLSAGGGDKCIFQWKHTTAVSVSAIDGDLTSHSGGHSAHEEHHHADDADFDESDDVLENAIAQAKGGGDEFMAVKPWLGAIRAPSKPPPINPAKPSSGLSLHWVHGYSSETPGTNLFYNCTGDAIYPAAALGVRLSRSSSGNTTLSQAYFTGHDDDVTSLTISSNRRFVATGQTASKTSKGKGSIHIWDALQCRLLSSMVGCHQRSVVALAFSSDGERLVSVGGDDNHTHILWKDVAGSWTRVRQLASDKCDNNNIIFCHWGTGASDFHWVSGGSKSIHFWSLEGAKLSRKQGRFGNKFKQQPLLCAANLVGNSSAQKNAAIVVGTAGGDLYTFKDKECVSRIKAHEGAVLCLREVWEGPVTKYMVSGGKDSCIRIWNESLSNVLTFTTSSIEHCMNSAIGSVDYRMDGNSMKLLLGLVGGEIAELHVSNLQTTVASSDDNASTIPADCTILVHSHSVGELWGLATHPLNADVIATAGDDRTVRLWSVSQCKLLDSCSLDRPARALGWSPCGQYLAVGFLESEKLAGGGKNAVKAKAKAKKTAAGGVSSGDGAEHSGACHILRMVTSSSTAACLTFDKTFTAVKCCESLSTVSSLKFSPTGNMLSVATHDQKLYTFELSYSSSEPTTPVLVKLTEFKRHSSAVLHFDFSEEEAWLQSTCQAYELLFSNPRTGQQLTSASKLADVRWATWTCPLGWPVQGIWPPGADGSDINSVDRSHSKALVATADDFGKVKLFRYPCVTENSKFNEFSGHSSHVTNVRWMCDDSCLVSVGGNDKCVFVWRVVDGLELKI